MLVFVGDYARVRVGSGQQWLIRVTAASERKVEGTRVHDDGRPFFDGGDLCVWVGTPSGVVGREEVRPWEQR